MSPPIPSARFKRETFQIGERIRAHSLNFVAGMMSRGSIRKGEIYKVNDSLGLTWEAKCVAWSGVCPIWEILGVNRLSQF